MGLSDVDIQKALADRTIQIQSTDPDNYPFEPEKQIRFASIDIRIGNHFMRYKKNVKRIDIVTDSTRIDQLMERLPDTLPGEEVVLKTGEILIAPTLERLILSKKFSARIVPRSSIARLGISVTCGSDFINPGQNGTLSLQLINHNRFPVSIRPYISICQLIIDELSSPASQGYSDRVGIDSRYPYETEIMPSRIGLDAEVQRILHKSGIETEDPTVKQLVARAIQNQRKWNERELAQYLIKHLPVEPKVEDVSKTLEDYMVTRPSLQKRLRIISWFSSIIFGGTIVWLINNMTDVIDGSREIQSLLFPGIICLLSLPFVVLSTSLKR